jgi:predicted dehydrogenase
MERMSEPVRWGVVATGGIASKFVTDLGLVPDARVMAVASRTPEPAQRFAAEFGIERAYGRWSDLAGDPDVEIVYVATPHVAHHAAAKMMLEAGKAVLCEKPIALNTVQAEDLTATATANNVFLAEAMWMRAIPAIRRAVELVASGAIGEVHALAADFSFASGAGPRHRLRDPALGGGALLDVGVYPLALAQLILGTPSHVRASARRTPQGVDETTAVLLDYPNGANAQLSCSFAASGPVTATISGAQGHIALANPFYRGHQVSLHHGRDGEVERFDVPFEGIGLRFPAIEAGACVRAGRATSDLLSLPDTLAVMHTMDTVRGQIGVRYPADRE